ncbi:hypothetical protein OHT52_05605 [Streptomyces sp. NBC_00247]|uniref:hypothetical protein n=1 Tax=Streptomyces sp. NBC_00247 TaxID=2975689 RepID=UPI002E28BDF2|nr:hypothetical protein [Streptomyces sp. NBC_00247]
MSADDYRAKFADFLRTQPATAGLTREDVERATTREELGISSLNMILLLVNYIKEEASDSVQLRPEWVSRLGSVDGIVSVVREIDESALAAAK